MNENVTNSTLPKTPDDYTLRQQLDLQWRDHIDIREQTWKALQMVALLFVGYIGSGLKVSDRLAIWVGGLTCMLAACFGIAVTVHHRKAQIEKFKFIHNLEEKLGLHGTDLLAGLKPPSEFRWAHLLNFRNLKTPQFILLMHVAIFILAALYVMVRGGK